MFLDKKRRYAFVINVLTLILEIIAFIIRPNRYDAPAWAFYTVISNIIAGLSSIFFLITFFSGKWRKFTAICRYTACIFLIVTFLVVVFVLVWYVKPSQLLLDYNNSFHHVIIPIGTVISYLLLEEHIKDKRAIFLPLLLSFIYSIIIVLCNCAGRFEGPYPFFMTQRFGLPAVLGYCVLIAGAIFGICFLFYKLGLKTSEWK